MAILVITFLLDKIKLDKEKEEGVKEKITLKLFIATFKHMWDSPYQKLLIPLTIYSGIEQAFIGADFTKVSTFVHVHYVTLCVMWCAMCRAKL